MSSDRLRDSSQARSNYDLLSSGLYRLGMVLAVGGLGITLVTYHDIQVPIEGWTTFVIGLVLAANGAAEPLAELVFRYYEEWRYSEVDINV